MIVKQYRDVISDRKTQTRRLNADFYKVGSIHSIVPERTKPTVAYGYLAGQLQVWHEQHTISDGWKLDNIAGYPDMWQPLKIRILAKWQESLQAITEADALAEGVYPIQSVNTKIYYECSLYPGRHYDTAVGCYWMLWDSVNHVKKYQWTANPLIWVVKFERVVGK